MDNCAAYGFETLSHVETWKGNEFIALASDISFDYPVGGFYSGYYATQQEKDAGKPLKYYKKLWDHGTRYPGVHSFRALARRWRGQRSSVSAQDGKLYGSNLSYLRKAKYKIRVSNELSPQHH
jgi:hypothetical protein